MSVGRGVARVTTSCCGAAGWGNEAHKQPPMINNRPSASPPAKRLWRHREPRVTRRHSVRNALHIAPSHRRIASIILRSSSFPRLARPRAARARPIGSHADTPFISRGRVYWAAVTSGGSFGAPGPCVLDRGLPQLPDSVIIASHHGNASVTESVPILSRFTWPRARSTLRLTTVRSAKPGKARHDARGRGNGRHWRNDLCNDLSGMRAHSGEALLLWGLRNQSTSIC